MNDQLPKGWINIQFGDVVKNVMESEKNPSGNGLERFIGLEHLDPDDLLIKRWGLIEEGTSFTKKAYKGQVLFGKRRVYQHKAAIADFDALISGDILVFETKNNDLIRELLPFIVQQESFFDYAINTSAGSLSPRTKWKDLAKYQFPLPPIAEQQRIADVLWAVEDCIRKWEDVKTNLELFFNVFLFNVFSNNNGLLKHNNISSYKIEDIADIRGRIGWRGLKAEEYTENGPFLIAAKHIINSSVDWDSCDHLSEFRYDESPEIKLEEGDIIISKDGTIGRIAFINKLPYKATINSTMMLVRVVEQRVIPKFLYYYFQGTGFKKLIISKMSGSTIPHLFQRDMKVLKIRIPVISVQKKIIGVLEKLEKDQSYILNHLQGLKCLKKSLLNELLTGKRSLKQEK